VHLTPARKPAKKPPDFLVELTAKRMPQKPSGSLKAAASAGVDQSKGPSETPG